MTIQQELEQTFKKNLSPCSMHQLQTSGFHFGSQRADTHVHALGALRYGELRFTFILNRMKSQITGLLTHETKTRRHQVYRYAQGRAGSWPEPTHFQGYLGLCV